MARIDVHVMRSDGHFKAHRRVNTEEKGGIGPERALAILGRDGYLLGELRFYKTQSGVSHAVALRHIPQARFRHGLPPPHIITDNPSVLDGVPDPLAESDWGYPGRKYISAGDPTHRKIEFREAVGSSHQYSGCAIRDFSYVIRRFFHMVGAILTKISENACVN